MSNLCCRVGVVNPKAIFGRYCEASYTPITRKRCVRVLLSTKMARLSTAIAVEPNAFQRHRHLYGRGWLHPTESRGVGELVVAARASVTTNSQKTGCQPVSSTRLRKPHDALAAPPSVVLRCKSGSPAAAKLVSLCRLVRSSRRSRESVPAVMKSCMLSKHESRHRLRAAMVFLHIIYPVKRTSILPCP